MRRADWWLHECADLETGPGQVRTSEPEKEPDKIVCRQPAVGSFPLRGMTANPPAGLVVIVRKEGAHAGLGSDTHVVELLLVVFQRSLQKQIYLHAVITAAAPHFELPDGPVANPQRGGDRQQPDQTAFHDQSHSDAPSSRVSGICARQCLMNGAMNSL